MKAFALKPLLYLLLLPAVGQPQNVVRTAGLSGSASVFEYSFRGYLEPYAAWGNIKKQLIIAPTLLVASNMGYQSPQIVRLTGARFGYRFFPSIKDSKWGFYVSADLRMQRLKDYWNANSFNEKSQDYQEHTIKTVELLAENYIGYGLKYSINQSFSLSQGVGLGWYISGLKTKSDHTLNNMVDLVDYRGYDDLGFVWNIRFEINYWF